MANSVMKSAPKLLEAVKNGRVQNILNPRTMEEFCKSHNLLSAPTSKSSTISRVGGERAYMLLGSLARLERALMQWSIDELVMKHNFKPIVVPNILHDHIIEKCGFPTKSKRSQVYRISGNSDKSILDEYEERIENQPNNNNQDELKHEGPCIAGTSEFALVSLHIGDTIPSDRLPKKFCALSRCYRAETSETASESGLYRVHYFNKVEMVALTMPDKSEEMHDELLGIQKSLFSQLGLSYQVLDMPEDDLGLSASKKYDIEAWLAARHRHGEISSTSNCRDYQSSRLNIKYSKIMQSDDRLDLESDFVHTVNGTACSSTRTMIAIIEQNQTDDDRVEIPEPLRPYMGGATHMPTEDDKRLLANINLYPE